MTVQEIYESPWNDFGVITSAINAAREKIEAQNQPPAGTGKVAQAAVAKPTAGIQGKTKELIGKVAAGANSNAIAKKTDSDNPEEPEVKKNEKSYAWLYVLIVIIVFVIIAYFVFFRKKAKK
jgi:ABC-type transport system involved in multi-copper enzyme maturation permease subunit